MWSSVGVRRSTGCSRSVVRRCQRPLSTSSVLLWFAVIAVSWQLKQTSPRAHPLSLQLCDDSASQAKQAAYVTHACRHYEQVACFFVISMHHLQQHSALATMPHDQNVMFISLTGKPRVCQRCHLILFEHLRFNFFNFGALTNFYITLHYIPRWHW